MLKKEFQASIIIAKPLEDTFLFTSDPNNLLLWNGASAVEVVTETPEKIGSEYRVVFSSFLSKSSVLIKIMEYNSPTLWAFQAQEPLGLFSYVFEQVEWGTKVTLTYQAEQIISFVANLITERKMNKLLANLKKYLEQ